MEAFTVKKAPLEHKISKQAKQVGKMYYRII